jgi:hypothetical protein
LWFVGRGWQIFAAFGSFKRKEKNACIFARAVGQFSMVSLRSAVCILQSPVDNILLLIIDCNVRCKDTCLW